MMRRMSWDLLKYSFSGYNAVLCSDLLNGGLSIYYSNRRWFFLTTRHYTIAMSYRLKTCGLKVKLPHRLSFMCKDGYRWTLPFYFLVYHLLLLLLILEWRQNDPTGLWLQVIDMVFLRSLLIYYPLGQVG